jgi:hypothetical protein
MGDCTGRGVAKRWRVHSGSVLGAGFERGTSVYVTYRPRRPRCTAARTRRTPQSPSACASGTVYSAFSMVPRAAPPSRTSTKGRVDSARESPVPRVDSSPLCYGGCGRGGRAGMTGGAGGRVPHAAEPFTLATGPMTWRAPSVSPHRHRFSGMRYTPTSTPRHPNAPTTAAPVVADSRFNAAKGGDGEAVSIEGRVENLRCKNKSAVTMHTQGAALAPLARAHLRAP